MSLFVAIKTFDFLLIVFVFIFDQGMFVKQSRRPSALALFVQDVLLNCKWFEVHWRSGSEDSRSDR
jgi:hypothetical protein